MKIPERKITGIENSTSCYHCGENCKTNDIAIGSKIFCCNGCKTVYELLNENDLCNYYSYEENPGQTQNKPIFKGKYDFLDDDEIKNELIEFTDGNITKASFYIPSIHCSSCIWLLENLFKIDQNIYESKVNFVKKEVTVKFSAENISLKEVVELLDSIGYEPLLNLDSEDETEVKTNKNLYYKIGVAGFSFGNIMLLSFPEYLSVEGLTQDRFGTLFGWINLILALPVFFYSASEYYLSAYKGLKKKYINIDVPITIGIVVLFLRSSYEIISQTGAGFFDSLAGLVFFLLIGKLFQSKTYERLNFDRNFKSYFPLSITVKSNGKEQTKPVKKLNVGDRIIVRNNEIIPADSILISPKATIDYSFVTGESTPIDKNNGDQIYAGGKQLGEAVELDIVKEVSQSYLTKLWNNEAFSKEDDHSISGIANTVSKYFTYIILAIALITFSAWSFFDLSIAFNTFTAVLIVACPCALALSTPFTLGHTLRILGRNKFYLKSTDIVESMSKISHIVFDKTGTITETSNSSVKYSGKNLTKDEEILIKSLTRNSSHPLSKSIYNYLSNIESIEVDRFDEIPGKGIEAFVNGKRIKIGSKSFVKNNEDIENPLNTQAFISIDNEFKGRFVLSNKYREGLKTVTDIFKSKFDLSLLSGDNESEKPFLKSFFNETDLYFNQSPQDKLDFISTQQSIGKNVLMIGDGLNDAGALKQSNVGIAMTDDINNFTPSSDAILEGSNLRMITKFIDFSKTSMHIIFASFVISFLYNVVGLAFAISGNLSPIVAAILMPLSSISVVVFTTLTTNIFAKKRGLL